MNNLFPLGIATGYAFCNRAKEREQLKYNMLNSRHTLIVMTRRYGKSSLLAQTFEDVAPLYDNMLMEKISLLTAYDMDSVLRTILNSIGKLAGKMLPRHEIAVHAMKQAFQRMSPEWSIGISGPRVKLTPLPRAVDMLTEALLDVDRIAGERGLMLTLAMDEFQQISMLDKNDALSIEAAVREAAQNSKHTCLIFTGSSRAMLTLMFEDKARPFFHLCEKMTLERICKEEYTPFLNNAAIDQWGVNMPDAVTSTILHLTKRHPYYVNALCSRLWRQENMPVSEDAASEWQQICDQEGMRIGEDIALLKPNQRAVLNALAVAPTMSPYSKDFLSRINISNGSMQRVIPFLLERDFIYIDSKSTYRLIDPCLEQYLVSLAAY